MPFLRPGIRKLLRLGDGREVDDEIALHLELRIESLMREGLTRDEATAEATRLFAQSDASLRALHATAHARDDRMRLHNRWESVQQDLRYAARRLLREPAVTLFMVLTLALGIGANVTAFSLIDRILLRGPEYVVDRDALSRLYLHVEGPPFGSQTMGWISHPVYDALRRDMRGVLGLGVYRVDDQMIGAGAAAKPQRIGTADGSFFPLLGAKSLIGRFFVPSDESENATIAVLSEATWRNDFGADPAVLGKSYTVDDKVYTIVGVAPAGFTGAALDRVDAWKLIGSDGKKSQNWNVIVRRKPGVSVATVSIAAEAARRLSPEVAPKWAPKGTLLATPMGYDDAGNPSLESVLARWLGVISLIILVITCANLVNLQLARLARRNQELGIRVALGAGRARVLRLLVFEGVLVAIAGGVGSLFVARITEPLIRSVLFVNAGFEASVVDGRVLLAVGTITLLTALVVGVIPALRMGSDSLTASLKNGARVAGGRSQMRHALTVVQAALSVVLLVGAGLFLRSMAHVRALDLGMDAERVVVAEARFPKATGTFEERSALERSRYRQLLDAVRQEPGVERAALTVGLPFYSSFGVGLWVPGMDSIPQLPGGGPYITAVNGDYFATMGTKLQRGRVFTDQDREGSEPVVIVGAAMAKLLWPSADALTKCITLYARTAPCVRVVGIVADIHRNGLREEASLQYYVPIGQEKSFSGMSIVIQPSEQTALSWSALKARMMRADPGIVALDVKVLGNALAGELRPLRLGMITFGLSAVLALVVAALGLYSVMAYMVAWRTHEIGVRMALGATEGSVARLVVGNSAALAGIGIVIGLVACLLGRRLIEAQLFEVSGADPVVFAGVAGSVLLVALLAGWLPARRAARIRPTEALRAE
ncbi:MAG: ADOP family duplicated permease [Gemmatimonadales bacterium]